MAKSRKIPEHLIKIFKNDLDEHKMNEAIVIFILDNNISDNVVYKDIADEFALVKALYRLYMREVVKVNESRISKIVKIKKAAKQESKVVEKPSEV